MTDFYGNCAHIKRPAINNAVADDVSLGYALLPLYEKSSYEYTRKRHYSLKTNEYLKCRWQCYVDNLKNRRTEPVQFLNKRDLHVFNGQITYRPWDTFINRKDYRYNLRPGPGVDSIGQLPIPNELLLKRGVEGSHALNQEPGQKKNVKESITYE